MVLRRPSLAMLCALSAAACSPRGQDRFVDTTHIATVDTQQLTTTSSAVPADPDTAGARRARMGVVFDPARVRIGDTIAGLVVEKIGANPNVIDSTLVGSAVFQGEIELTGATLRHPEADAGNEVCFEADSASAERLPRWSADRRRAWFCFTNPAEARRALGAGAAERPARIVISNFVINRGLSDQINSARFVRLLDR